MLLNGLLHRKRRIRFVLVGVALAATCMFIAGFVSGALIVSRNMLPASIISGEPPAEITTDTTTANFGVFWEAWRVIQSNFHEGPLDPKVLRDGAIGGLAGSTGDPYTIYQDADAARRARTRLAGNFDGVGIRVKLRDGWPFIVQPLPRSPAEANGVGKNEFVLAVDGVSTEGLSLAAFGQLVRGPRGTAVTLRLKRLGETAWRDVTLVRDRIAVDSVSTERIDDVGYIRINNFSARTSEEVREALANFQSSEVDRMVLDLRNNHGGLLNAGVGVASLFLLEGQTVLRQERRDHPAREFLASANFRDTKSPLVVLVNDGTASAAEIVAGALQAHSRAVLVGEQTFGKGSMQELHRLSDDSTLRVTSGVWITPAGVNLAGTGLIPDIVVENTDDLSGGVEDPVLRAGLRTVRQID